MKTTEVNRELIGRRCECIFTGNGRYRGHGRKRTLHGGKSPLRPPAPVGR